MNWLNRLHRKTEDMGKRQEFFAVALLSVAMVFGIVAGMGTLTSGYHLVDDHEFLEWIYQMRYQKVSVWEIIAEKIRQDFVWRYEPAYYFTRILSTRLFGMDLLGYSLVKAAEITVSCIFLYYCARRMGASKV